MSNLPRRFVDATGDLAGREVSIGRRPVPAKVELAVDNGVAIDHDPHRAARARRPGHRLLSHRRRDQQRPDGRPALRRHDWHGEWNYTLLPYRPDAVTSAAAVTTATAEHHDRAWLSHPVLTGLPAPDWNQLLARLAAFRYEQREIELDRQRGGPRTVAEGTGRKPSLTLADRVAATLLHYRFGLPQTVIAELFGVTLMTANRAIRQLNPLLEQAGHTLTPASTRIRCQRWRAPTEGQMSVLIICKPLGRPGRA
jgi:hypothetical protein